jgi:hypothetical protein
VIAALLTFVGGYRAAILQDLGARRSLLYSERLRVYQDATKRLYQLLEYVRSYSPEGPPGTVESRPIPEDIFPSREVGLVASDRTVSAHTNAIGRIQDMARGDFGDEIMPVMQAIREFEIAAAGDLGVRLKNVTWWWMEPVLVTIHREPRPPIDDQANDAGPGSWDPGSQLRPPGRRLPR